MLYALLVVLYGVVQFVDSIEKFGEIVKSITSGSGSPSQLDDIESQLGGLSAQVQGVSVQIAVVLAEIDEILQTDLKNDMSDILTKADDAGIALAEWEKTKDSNQRDYALNISLDGLDSIVEKYNNNAYPGPSMVLVLARLLLQRLAILAVFPKYRTKLDTAQLRTALQYLLTEINAIATPIYTANQVAVSTSVEVVVIPSRPPITRTFYEGRVGYSNVLGDKTFNKSVTAGTLQQVQNDLPPLVAEADQVRAQGLAEDLAYAQVTSLRKVYATAQPLVG
jgi:hypothetical protein